jgi:hypothetical protein
MGVVGDLSKYTQFQAAEALRTAAAAGGGGGMAGTGVGLGAGLAMAQHVMGTLGGLGAPAAPPASGMVPPPLPGAVQFHVGVNGAATGPFDAASLAAKVSQGVLTRDTLVWRQGMAGWVKAGDVAELAALFPAQPPPLPT